MPSPQTNTQIIPDISLTTQGNVAARIGDVCYLVHRLDGQLYLASDWRLQKPIHSWSIADFQHSRRETINDIDAAHTRFAQSAHHQNQRAQLNRRSHTARRSSPWGTTQSATNYGPAIVCYDTASHGGFHVAPSKNVRIDPKLRNANGWYEEDSEWAKVAISFPTLFTDHEIDQAWSTIRNDYPDVYERLTNTKLQPGQSTSRDEQHFYTQHCDDLIVVSAITMPNDPQTVLCTATRGGHKHHTHASTTHQFCVARDEYRSRSRYGFVIDETRHQPYLADIALETAA